MPDKTNVAIKPEFTVSANRRLRGLMLSSGLLCLVTVTMPAPVAAGNLGTSVAVGMMIGSVLGAVAMQSAGAGAPTYAAPGYMVPQYVQPVTYYVPPPVDYYPRQQPVYYYYPADNPSRDDRHDRHDHHRR